MTTEQKIQLVGELGRFIHNVKEHQKHAGEYGYELEASMKCIFSNAARLVEQLVDENVAVQVPDLRTPVTPPASPSEDVPF